MNQYQQCMSLHIQFFVETWQQNIIKFEMNILILVVFFFFFALDITIFQFTVQSKK